MLEQMLNSKTKAGVPGSSTLLIGDDQLGYYAPIPASSWITGSALASLVGLTAGTLMNDGIDWFKFAYKGAILLVPQKPLRYNLSWDSLNALGLVSGKNFTIRGRTYKVRLMQGSVSNPFTGVNDSADAPQTVGSEYNNLMYRVCVTNPPSETAPSFATFTQTDLGFRGNGGCQMCMEASRPSGGGVGVVNRCDAVSDFSTIHSPPSAYTDVNRGWRPVLELVP